MPSLVLKRSSLDVKSDLDDSHESSEFIETGKQLVSEFRQGLWSSFQDFKQRTAGGEGISTAGLHSAPALAPGGVSKRRNVTEKPPL